MPVDDDEWTGDQETSSCTVARGPKLQLVWLDLAQGLVR